MGWVAGPCLGRFFGGRRSLSRLLIVCFVVAIGCVFLGGWLSLSLGVAAFGRRCCWGRRGRVGRLVVYMLFARGIISGEDQEEGMARPSFETSSVGI